MWEKWAQNQKKTQTILESSAHLLYELLTSSCTLVKNLIFPNVDVVWVSWKHSEYNITACKTLTWQLLPT